jgi:hypothetical protein
VVRPYGNEQDVALSINPYHLGFAIWEDIIERDGIEAARRICAEEDDFGFIRNHPVLADKLELFSYQERNDGETRVLSRDIHAVREAILGPKYNYGAPCIAVEQMNDDFSLRLRHDHNRDGRGWIWRRPSKCCNTWRASAPAGDHAHGRFPWRGTHHAGHAARCCSYQRVSLPEPAPQVMRRRVAEQLHRLRDIGLRMAYIAGAEWCVGRLAVVQVRMAFAQKLQQQQVQLLRLVRAFNATL